MKVARDVDEGIGAGFAPGPDAERWSYVGPLTYQNAAAVLKAATALMLPLESEVDLRDIGAVDSSAVAVLIALKRRAAEESRPLTFVNVPDALLVLADLYGVEDILTK